MSLTKEVISLGYADKLHLPSRSEVRVLLNGLCLGAVSRAAASDWAAKWMAAEQTPSGYDKDVWTALDRLFGADTIGQPDLPDADEDVCLYQNDDFKTWLSEFDNACSNDG